jgi:hypothetical protein
MTYSGSLKPYCPYRYIQQNITRGNPGEDGPLAAMLLIRCGLAICAVSDTI